MAEINFVDGATTYDPSILDILSFKLEYGNLKDIQRRMALMDFI